MDYIENRLHRHITSFRIIILGFFSVILLGSFFLMLPQATQDGMGASFSDALFTATSAVCVTGLVVHDTATYWSFFGQTIIVLLIQIGGMGCNGGGCNRNSIWTENQSDAEKCNAGSDIGTSSWRYCADEKIYFKDQHID